MTSATRTHGWFDLQAVARRAAAALQADGELDRAAERLMSAARHAAGQFQHDTAVELLTEARTIDGVSGELIAAATLLELRIRAAMRNGDDADRALRRTMWTELLDQARAEGDEQGVARALMHLHADALDDSGTALEEACEIEMGWGARARAWRARAAGRLEEALEHDSAAVESAQQLRDRLLEARAFEGLAGTLGWLGRVREAADLSAHAAVCYEQLGDAAGAISARASQAEGLALALELDEAAYRIDDEARRLHRAAGAYWHTLVACQQLRIELLRGNVTRAAQQARSLMATLPVSDDGDIGARMSLLRAAEALLDAGDLTAADTALTRARAHGADSEHDAVEDDLRVLDARAALADDPDELAAIIARVDLPALEDPFLRAEAASWLAWRVVLQLHSDSAARETLLTQIEASLAEVDADPADVLLVQLIDFVSALAAACRGDDRRIRACLHRTAGAGLELWHARLDAARWLTAGNLEQLTLCAARLESHGALADADVVTEAMQGVTGEAPAMHALLAHPALAGVEHGVAMRVVAASRTVTGGTRQITAPMSLLVVDGRVSATDASGLALVATSGALVHLDADAASELELTTIGVVWQVERELAREMLGAERAVTRRVTDHGLDVAGRIEGLLGLLVSNCATRGMGDDGLAELDVELVQQDIAQLASTSRKSATLVLNELRRAGVAQVQRGRVRVAIAGPVVA